jgi:hypothetical protein
MSETLQWLRVHDFMMTDAEALRAIDAEARAIEKAYGNNWSLFPADVAKRHYALFVESLRLQNPHAELATPDVPDHDETKSE